ncbi:hypothetical protein, partial [Roseovarius autotrophicus]|uniref:hypothetical protein n=1 Tax=Roseovarius autotrophicus TaxID=2824121 RepID=UPI001B386369
MLAPIELPSATIRRAPRRRAVSVMEWMPPSPTASQCAKLWALKPSKSKEASVKEVTIIGVDLA